jgi:Mg-chelatase subunit ChlD
MARTRRSAPLFGVLAVAGLLAAAAAPPADAFKTFRLAGGNIHEQMIRRVLSARGFTEAAIVQVDKGATSQDIVGSSNFEDGTHHFDNNLIDESRAYAERVVNSVVGMMPRLIPATESPEDRDKAVKARDEAQYAWGQMVHAVQDFYSHSNYLELVLRAGTTAPMDIPPIDWANRPPGLKTGYFLKIELVSRDTAARNIQAANPGITLRTPAEYTVRANTTRYADAIAFVTGPPQVLHCELNKDNDSELQGKVIEPRSTRTLSALAQEIAVKETERQWTELQRRIRETHGERAADMIRRFQGHGTPDISVLFLVDTSGSMSGPKIQEARKAVADLVKEANAAGRAEEWAILSFGNHNAFEVQPFTQNLSTLEAAAARLGASGDTPLRYGQAKAIAYLLENGKGKEGKLIILCDGDDNCPGPAHQGGAPNDRASSGAANAKLQRLFQTLKLPRGGSQ